MTSHFKTASMQVKPRFIPVKCYDCGVTFPEMFEVVQECIRSPWSRRLLCINCDPEALRRPHLELRNYTVSFFDLSDKEVASAEFKAFGFQDLARQISLLPVRSWLISFER